ncbi:MULTISPECIES: hypothetical protein [Aphanothece]|uniref:hypothetical protein n=1 Tax=Aphanothece TaxID=1121 RepID=UPI003984EB05
MNAYCSVVAAGCDRVQTLASRTIRSISMSTATPDGSRARPWTFASAPVLPL